MCSWKVATTINAFQHTLLASSFSTSILLWLGGQGGCSIISFQTPHSSGLVCSAESLEPGGWVGLVDQIGSGCWPEARKKLSCNSSIWWVPCVSSGVWKRCRGAESVFRSIGFKEITGISSTGKMLTLGSWTSVISRPSAWIIESNWRIAELVRAGVWHWWVLASNNVNNYSGSMSNWDERHFSILYPNLESYDVEEGGLTSAACAKPVSRHPALILASRDDWAASLSANALSLPFSPRLFSYDFMRIVSAKAAKTTEGCMVVLWMGSDNFSKNVGRFINEHQYMLLLNL